eukprot:gene25402-48177_t
MMLAKFQPTAALLAAGVRVVFSEMDIFWKRNVLDLDRGADDGWG